MGFIKYAIREVFMAMPRIAMGGFWIGLVMVLSGGMTPGQIWASVFASFPEWAGQPWFRIGVVLLGFALMIGCLVAGYLAHRKDVRNNLKHVYLPIRKAIDYVALESEWGVLAGIGRPSFEVPLLAIDRFNEVSREGSISARGRRKYTSDHMDIDPWEWRAIQLDELSVLNPDAKSTTTTHPRDHFVNQVAQYDDILVKVDCLENLWPRATMRQRLKKKVVEGYLEWKVKREQKQITGPGGGS